MVIVRVVDLSATTLSRAFGGRVLHWLTLLAVVVSGLGLGVSATRTWWSASTIAGTLQIIRSTLLTCPP
jgi:hypothetical protein